MLTKKDKNVATAEAIRTEAQDRIRSIALPILPGENIKAQWRKVSRKTGLTCRRVRTLWYGQAPTIHAHELEIIRAFTVTTEQVDRAINNTADLYSRIVDLQAQVAALHEFLGKMQNGQGFRASDEAADRSIGGTKAVGWIGRTS